MLLENLVLNQFKNYEFLEADTRAQVVCFVGENGSGKTNLLDAIHYLSLTKSAFSSSDQQTIRHGEEFFSVMGHIEREGHQHKVICGLRNGEKKILTVDKNPYDKISEHVGEFPSVLIAPDDTDLIREGSEERRKFFDNMLSQINKEYLRKLMSYNHVLKQRNALLKQFAESQRVDSVLIEHYDNQLLTWGREIFETRKQFLEDFRPVFQERYGFIADQKEQTDIQYQSHFQDIDFEKNFRSTLKKDILLQRTTMGIHKDDFEFLIDGLSIKKLGSQGQKKSFIIALKLAQFRVIYQNKGYKPLLLLDDIFDKLDDKRIKHLMEMVSEQSFGQIFLTDARPERTIGLFSEINVKPLIYRVDSGQLSLIS